MQAAGGAARSRATGTYMRGSPVALDLAAATESNGGRLLGALSLEECAAQLRGLTYLGSGTGGTVWHGTWRHVPVAAKVLLADGDDDGQVCGGQGEKGGGRARPVGRGGAVLRSAWKTLVWTGRHAPPDGGGAPGCTSRNGTARHGLPHAHAA